MVHKYKDPKSGTIKNLTTDEHDEFDCLIEAIYKEDTESVIDIIESTPIVVHALSEETGNMALGFAVRHLNANGLIYTELLLRNGADVFLKNKKGFSALDDIKAINGPYRQKFLDLAYKYAKTFDERMEIDPLRNISGYTEERKEDIETVNRIIDKKKAKSDKCTICKVDKIIYDNELLNHPKVQQIMEVANSQKVVDQLLDLTKDKEVASALISAIDERYEEAISTLLADGADAETVELISDAIYSMKIEEVLGTMFFKSESEEVGLCRSCNR